MVSIALIALFVPSFLLKKNIKKCPPITIYVKVLSKRTEQNMRVSGSSINGSGSTDGFSYTTYFITFEFNNGERLEISVPQNVYGTIFPGDTGNLTYKHFKNINFFESFVRDK